MKTVLSDHMVLLHTGFSVALDRGNAGNREIKLEPLSHSQQFGECCREQLDSHAYLYETK